MLEEGGEPGPLAKIEGPVGGLERILPHEEIPPTFLVTGALLTLFGKTGRDPERALEYAERAVAATGGRDAPALLARALSHLARGGLEKAFADAEAASRLGPRNRFRELLRSRLDGSRAKPGDG